MDRSGTRTAICGILASALSFYTVAFGAEKTVHQIVIKSHWGGLGTPQNADLLIRQEKGAFVLDGKRIDTALVEALATAMNEAAIKKPDLGNLGLTPAWFKANGAAAALKNDRSFEDAAPNQKELFNKTFNDSGIMGRIVPSLFGTMRTDDYPSVVVTVTYDDGSTMSAKSVAWDPFMLPWLVGRNGERTYNANISRALATVMPQKTTNRDRLTGKGFDAAIAEGVMRYIERDWKLLDAENRAGEAVAVLRRVYTVKTAEIDSYHHPEYGKEWTGGKPHETNLHASLSKPTFPQNVVDALVLQSANGKIEGVDQFLRSAEKYESLALSVPWLREYIQKHPQVPVRISYVHNASFGDKAMEVFTADMHAKGRDDLVPPAKAKQSEIALLIVGQTYAESYWLVFPDRHLMLWRFGGPSGLLKWKTDDFPAGRCAAYSPPFGGCAGSVVSASGELVRDSFKPDEACVATHSAGGAAGASRPDVLFPVHDHGKGGFIDRNGRIAIPLCFETVGEFSEGLARFERDGRWGFIDEAGSVVIQPQFSWVRDFSEGLARAQVKGEALEMGARSGFIDKSGKVVLPPRYGAMDGVAEAEEGFRNGLAMIQVDGKKGFIDPNGRIVIKSQFGYAYQFSDGLAAVSADHEGNKWGFINMRGEWVIPPTFEWASSFSEGLAPVNRTYDCGYIDKTGALALRPPVPRGETDCATVWAGFNEGLSRWKFGNKYGYIDHNGKVVIAPQFDLTFGFSEGLAAVQVKGLWGYIDKSGRTVIEPRKLHSAESFHNGLAYVVTADGKHGYIDKSGKYVWEPTVQGNDY
jgi:hypothetical protein